MFHVVSGSPSGGDPDDMRLDLQYSSHAGRDWQESLALLSGACGVPAIDTLLLWRLRFSLQFLVLVLSEMFCLPAGLTRILVLGSRTVYMIVSQHNNRFFINLEFHDPLLRLITS